MTGHRLPLLALVPVALVAAALVVAGLRPPDTGTARVQPRTLAVAARTLSCLGLPGGVTRTTVAVGLTGDSRRARLDAPRLDLGGIGAWGSRRLGGPPASDGARGGVDIAGTGPGAAGLEAFVAAVGDRAAGGGLAVQHCSEPARSWWFVGAGSTAVRSGAIVLHAPPGAGAVVDVLLRGPDGMLETVGTQDIALDPGATRALPLADLVAGVDDVAVEVRASQGRVVAAVADIWAGTGRSAGTEWLPPAAEPAQTVVVPGVGSADRGRRPVLVVANGQERSVVARPALVTGSGRVPVPGLESVRVPAGGIVSVPLPTGIDAGSSLELRADDALTAAVRLTSGSDVAAPAGASTLSGPAAVPLDLGSELDVAVTVSALLVDPESQAVRSRTVAVRGVDASGAAVGAGSVELPAGTSRTIDLVDVLGLSRSAARSLAFVVLAPSPRGAGTTPVVAAVAVSDGDGSSVLPLDSPATTLTAPAIIAAVVPPLRAP